MHTKAELSTRLVCTCEDGFGNVLSIHSRSGRSVSIFSTWPGTAVLHAPSRREHVEKHVTISKSSKYLFSKTDVDRWDSIRREMMETCMNARSAITYEGGKTYEGGNLSPSVTVPLCKEMPAPTAITPIYHLLSNVQLLIR